MIQCQIPPGRTNSGPFRASSDARPGRVAGRKATYQGVSSFWRSVSRVIRTLWHEVTGLFFFVFGAIIAVAAVREYRHYTAGQYGPGRPILAACLALMFLYFALNAFQRANRK